MNELNRLDQVENKINKLEDIIEEIIQNEVQMR